MQNCKYLFCLLIDRDVCVYRYCTQSTNNIKTGTQKTSLLPNR
jgi:hypothetical protein